MLNLHVYGGSNTLENKWKKKTSFELDGIYFIDKNHTAYDSVKPEIGDTVYLKYKGSFLKAGGLLETFLVVDIPKLDVYIYKNESVLEGWERGIGMMNVKRPVKLIIPSDLAYGAQGAGQAIAPHASLIFEVELLDII